MTAASDGLALVDALRAGGTTEHVLAVFDALPPVEVGEAVGAWLGAGVPTGHPFDGLLERLGWHGKRFAGTEDGHPLVFRGARGTLWSVDPGRLPVALLTRRPGVARLPLVDRAFRGLLPLLATRAPRSRLRTVEHRGVRTAAMVYDAVPIIDVFRRVDDRTLLGVMDLRGMPRPFFFLLRRAPA
ncbi:DUF4334 domain-containing protein [Cellulomonas cellasea]|uniref:DUF4334 domain-containing protein n=1 Tax=Cellulomonas cellasea TaxID=43670 RepID=A0A7W4YAM6_9CELL|nr:DUF4334 domain-containing protein [Cellulomonas cellasea]MBB2921596.1 hypothetical protein [Cellulomonas cellasea]